MKTKTKTKIIWCPNGMLELGQLWETAWGHVEGEFLGAPRAYRDWAEADDRSSFEAYQWLAARQHEPDDTPPDYC